ncbi:FAD-dependent tricarballylate dehydrogenase TcuA [Virgibacillus sediminis]|uniref:FAD-dependent tricarballylate dehydrogenase TcuA n=1 Tax=Virgibacillus sediminis TaxID=202260 RepID=A0ABV7AA04_9BACI
MAKNTEEMDFDIVVVGCGVAGTAAALAAAEQAKDLGRPLRVVVLERSGYETRGGNSRDTAAYLRMEDETKVAENFVEEMMEFSGGRSDESYIRTLSEKAGETISWIKERGVEFDYLPTLFLTANRPRLLPVGGGRAILDQLSKHAERLDVQIAYHSTAWRLGIGEDGSVSEIWIRGEDGRSTKVTTRAIILANGGFQGNAEMLTRYLGKEAYKLPTIAPGGMFNKGEGIHMAFNIGAKSSGQLDSFHAEPSDPRSNRGDAAVMTYPYGILVDQSGNRFVDEGISTIDEQYEAVARRIFDLPEHVAYMISDQRMFDIEDYENAIQTEKPPIEADTIEELAEKINIPPEQLKKTVEDYNTAVQPGEFDPKNLDGKCTKGLSPEKSNWAVPIDKGPYICYPIQCSNVFTYGGVATDNRSRVLSQDDYPIPGLYAAGEITGLYHGKYPGGTSVLRGVVFGRIAGEEAAKYIVSEPETVR